MHIKQKTAELPGSLKASVRGRILPVGDMDRGKENWFQAC